MKGTNRVGFFTKDSGDEATGQRGVNGNLRDVTSSSKHAAVDETPYSDAVRTSNHEAKHAVFDAWGNKR